MDERAPAELVTALRKKYGSHDKLAAALGTSRQRVIAWEGGGGIGDGYAGKLARLADRPPADFKTPRRKPRRVDLREELQEIRDLLESLAGLVDAQWQTVEQQTGLVLTFAREVRETADVRGAAQAMYEALDALREGAVAEAQARLQELVSELEQQRRAL